MLYFIKGDSPKNWGATKLKLAKGASPSAVIAGMEKDGWKCVTVSAFNAWRKQNSRPTSCAGEIAVTCPEHGEPAIDLVHFSCGCFTTRPRPITASRQAQEGVLRFAISQVVNNKAAPAQAYGSVLAGCALDIGARTTHRKMIQAWNGTAGQMR